ncbi:MAG: hypothetical protein NZM00_02440, partial [Anaerolinea sp.]|nr:hypothetical protein [Anaerolinea sp.]
MIAYRLRAATAGGASDEFSADLIAASWRLGCIAPDENAAPPGEAVFTLANRSRRYSPARAWASPALRPSAIVTLEADVPGGPIRLFTGQIADISSDGDPFEPVTRIRARTLDAQFDHIPARLPALVNVDARTALIALLDGADLRRPDQILYWLLDQPGHAELNTTARLAPPFSAGAIFQPGISRFAYVGFGGGALTVAEVIRQISASEGGLFYADRFDRLRFLNRHARLRAAPAALTVADARALAYTFAGDVIGRVRVRIAPRRVGPSGSPLWTLDAPLRIDPGTRTLTVAFRQDDRPLAALAITGTAFTATTFPGGSAAAPVYVTVLRADSAGATLEISNPGVNPVYLTPGSAVLGTPLIADEPVIVEHINPLALHTFGGRTLTLAPPLFDDIESAAQLARFTLHEWSFPVGRIAEATLAADAPERLTVTIGDRVTVSAPSVQDGVTGFVIGEAHELDPRA